MTGTILADFAIVATAKERPTDKDALMLYFLRLVLKIPGRVESWLVPRFCWLDLYPTWYHGNITYDIRLLYPFAGYRFRHLWVLNFQGACVTLELELLIPLIGTVLVEKIMIPARMTEITCNQFGYNTYCTCSKQKHAGKYLTWQLLVSTSTHVSAHLAGTAGDAPCFTMGYQRNPANLQPS